MLDKEEMAGAYQRLGQRVHPPEHRVELTTGRKGERDRFDQAGSEFDVGNGQRMLHRFVRQIVLLIPGTGTPMQDGWQRRLYLLQVAAQHLGKQVVVAVPAPLVVE